MRDCIIHASSRHGRPKGVTDIWFFFWPCPKSSASPGVYVYILVHPRTYSVLYVYYIGGRAVSERRDRGREREMEGGRKIGREMKGGRKRKWEKGENLPQKKKKKYVASTWLRVKDLLWDDEIRRFSRWWWWCCASPDDGPLRVQAPALQYTPYAYCERVSGTACTGWPRQREMSDVPRKTRNRSARSAKNENVLLSMNQTKTYALPRFERSPPPIRMGWKRFYARWRTTDVRRRRRLSRDRHVFDTYESPNELQRFFDTRRFVPRSSFNQTISVLTYFRKPPQNPKRI